MQKLIVFNHVTLDGYFCDPNGDMSWAQVAEEMNSVQKFVFSTTLNSVSWKSHAADEGLSGGRGNKLKQESGQGIAILGSGTIVLQLPDTGLIDELQIFVNPVIFGKGRTLFEGMIKRLSLKRPQSRTFGNGDVLLTYTPK